MAPALTDMVAKDILKMLEGELQSCSDGEHRTCKENWSVHIFLNEKLSGRRSHQQEKLKGHYNPLAVRIPPTSERTS
jgi:hypothetical protein